jgi:hypothetical protein
MQDGRVRAFVTNGGPSATHRDELPDVLHELFWSRPNNVSAMHLLGYGAGGEDSRRQ